MIRKLRLKFIIVNMTIVTVMLIFMLGFQYRITAAGIRERSESAMRTMDMVPRRPGRPEFDDGDEFRLPAFAIIADENGNIIDAKGGYYDLSDEEMLNSLYASAMAEEEETGVIEEYGLRFLKRNTPKGTDVVFIDISPEEETMKTVLKSSILIGVGAFAVFLVISVLLARWAVKPVEEAFTRQKQFISDASHELKTPLTVILTNTEMLSGTEYSKEQQSGFVRNIQTMAEQMRGLVESLLELTRVDNGTSQLCMKEVDFSSLVEDAVLPFEPVFFEKNLSLSSQIEKHIMLRGDEDKLRQVVEILLDNAQKYCFPETQTDVSLVRQHNVCMLSVESCGETLTKEQLKDIFKRFYRVDKARSLNHSYGLGLSIAESIVNAHSGKIWAESSDGKNIFRVQLPV